MGPALRRLLGLMLQRGEGRPGRGTLHLARSSCFLDSFGTRDKLNNDSQRKGVCNFGIPQIIHLTPRPPVPLNP